MLTGMCWLPITLLCVERTIRGGRYAPFGLALAVACQLLNGSIEYALYNAYVAGLFSVFRLAPQTREAGWRLAAGRGALLVGCALAGAPPRAAPAVADPRTRSRVRARTRKPEVGGWARGVGRIQTTDFLLRALLTSGVLGVRFLPVLGLALGPGSRGLAGLWWFSLTAAALGALLASGGPLYEFYFRTPLGGMFRRPEKLLHSYGFGQSLLADLR